MYMIEIFHITFWIEGVKLERLFKIKENGSTYKTETIAGITTFLTMVYIIVVNPTILHAAGVPFDQVFMATVISAVVGTLMMGLLANYPIGIAPGMGMNAYFASVVATNGFSYQVVFGAVFIAGVIFILLSLTELRETLIGAIPPSLKFGITSGIGLFIAFLGLKMSGIVVASEENLVGLGNLGEPVTLLSIIGLFITLALMAWNVRGGLFIGMLITGLIAFFTGELEFTQQIVSSPPVPVFFDLDIAGVFTNSLYTVVIAFLLVTIFDTTGTMIGVAEQAGFMKNGVMPRAKGALLADATATTVGSMFGTSPSSAYVESTSGVAVGGRTGFTSIIIASLFVLSIFFSPIVKVIADLPAITAPVLIIVGCLMMNGLANINWSDFTEAFPAFDILISMPLTSSIATGIAIGFITYPLMKLIRGKGKEVHWILYVFGVIFVLQMIYFPAH